MNVIDKATVTILAQGPGANVSPEAPPGFGEKIDQLLSFTQYIAFGVLILAVIVTGATVAISRQQGTSEEVTSSALRIGGGIALVAGAVGVVSWFVGG